MKTSLVRPSIVLAALILSLQAKAQTAPGGSNSQAAPKSAESAPTQFTQPGKPYALFMGNNLAIERDKDFYMVNNVTGSDLVIKVKGQAKLIPCRELGPFKINYSLRISHISLLVEDLKIERCFTPDNDPGALMMQQAMLSSTMAQFSQESAVTREIRQASMQAAISQAKAEAANGGLNLGAQEKVAELTRASDKMMQGPAIGSVVNTTTPLGSIDMEAFDAVEVEFKVTAPVLIERAYYVFIAAYNLKDDAKGEGHKFIHAEEIGALGPAPTRLHFKAGGIPPGYQIKSHELHIYQGPRELASNLSDKRVDMTRENVETYLLVSHLGDHKGATIPPSAVRLPDPTAPKIQLQRAKLLDPVFVRVDPKGKLLRISADAAGKLDASPEVAQALRDFIFLPALDKGTPVEGLVSFRVIDHL